MLLGGYIAGSRIPNISQYLHYIIGVIILLSILPPIIGILKSRRGAGQPNAPAAAAVVPEAESK